MYPLTLNGLRLACNQSTNREPVVAYDDQTIRDALQGLERRGLTRLASGAGSRAAKYRHLLAERLPMSADEQAVMCVLMLRGHQTPGELKQRTERMHSFADLAAVEATLERLIDRELVASLDRQPGQKEERYAELLTDREACVGSEQPARDAGRSTPLATPAGSRPLATPAGARRSWPRRRRPRRGPPPCCRRSRSASSASSASWRSCGRPCSDLRGGLMVGQLPLLAASVSSGEAATGVGIPVAIVAGLVSFLSPCVLPLVPGYLSTVIGVAPADIQQAGARRVLVPSLLFIASFSSIFILLGLGATAVGSALNQHRETLETVGGAVIIAMGVLFIASQFVGPAELPVALGLAHAPGRERRAGGRGRRLRDRLDPLHERHPRGDPYAGRHLELGCSRGPAAGLLLGRSRDPLPGDRTRLRARHGRLDVVKRHFPVVIAVGGARDDRLGLLIVSGEFTTLNSYVQQSSLVPSV